MKITSMRGLDVVFRELDAGDTFMSSDKVYMKINENSSCNSIDLCDGTLIDFPTHGLVNKVECELIVRF